MLTIFIDADACPVKDEVYRVARRYAMRVAVVANAPLRVPADPLVELVVRPGFGAADDWIAEPPLNDLWTVPGEEHLLAAFQAEDRARFAGVNATTHYHALQIQDYLRAILEGRPPLVTGEDGRAVVEMFTAIYRSHREHRAIRFPLGAGE